MTPFVYESQPVRVVFERGALARLRGEVERLGLKRVLVLSTPEQSAQGDAARALLGPLAAGLFSGAVMHVPVPVQRAALAEAKRLGADGTVAIGGGSTTGLGKAIALETGIPIVAVPTTYAGSEMTPIWGLTEGGTKKTGRDPRVQPRLVIYDPALTDTLPAGLAATSGMNAMAHCVEALYAANANPVISLIAEEGIRALAASLPRVVNHTNDAEAKEEALYGAWLAGTSLGAVGMAVHHKLCHTLGGTYNLPHADTHTVVLPHAAAYNADAAPEAMARVARALGQNSAPTGLFDLARSLGAPTSLRELGLSEAKLDEAAELATRNPYDNPRPVTRDGIRALLDDAFHGRRPRESRATPGASPAHRTLDLERRGHA